MEMNPAVNRIVPNSLSITIAHAPKHNNPNKITSKKAFNLDIWTPFTTMVTHHTFIISLLCEFFKSYLIPKILSPASPSPGTI